MKYGLLDTPPHSHFWFNFIADRIPSSLLRTLVDLAIGDTVIKC